MRLSTPRTLALLLQHAPPRQHRNPTRYSVSDAVSKCSACTLCGDCCSGCNVGAKNTVQVTYLADAFHHGAEIFTEMRVTHAASSWGEGSGEIRCISREVKSGGGGTIWTCPVRSGKPRTSS